MFNFVESRMTALYDVLAFILAPFVGLLMLSMAGGGHASSNEAAVMAAVLSIVANGLWAIAQFWATSRNGLKGRGQEWSKSLFKSAGVDILSAGGGTKVGLWLANLHHVDKATSLLRTTAASLLVSTIVYIGVQQFFSYRALKRSIQKKAVVTEHSGYTVEDERLSPLQWLKKHLAASVILSASVSSIVFIVTTFVLVDLFGGGAGASDLMLLVWVWALSNSFSLAANTAPLTVVHVIQAGKRSRKGILRNLPHNSFALMVVMNSIVSMSGNLIFVPAVKWLATLTGGSGVSITFVQQTYLQVASLLTTVIQVAILYWRTQRERKRMQ